MSRIDWRKDYKGEFICPYCNTIGLKIGSKNNQNQKRDFICCNCGRCTNESYDIDLSKSNCKVNWRRDYQVGEFACPNSDCNTKNIRLDGNCKRKKRFRCGTCGISVSASIDLTAIIISREAHKLPSIKPFYFEDDKWDLRAILTSFDKQDNRFVAYFENVHLDWFKFQVKQYIYQLCKIDKPSSSIRLHLNHLRIFSDYLAQKKIAGMDKINRSVILEFLIWDRSGCAGIRRRLGVLRNFLITGTIQGWFDINQDIIRDDDFPKRKITNPDPIPDSVREQIEKNLHKLPEPIARMWFIAFFAAMRPSELALLKKDCLIQEGSSWKIIWQRKKAKDQHEVPITRTIAKVVQEQLEYIKQLWGDSWDYLFCHYQGFSLETAPSQLNLKPVMKVIHKTHDPLKLAIRCLINAENIRDDNDKLAKFSTRLVRPTRLTQLFEQGHDLAVVSAWAGHKQLVTTALHYTHVSCNLIENEAGHIQKALFNADGQYLSYESLPKSFWENPRAHKLDLPGDHINTPIYGYCGLSLDQNCDKFRACYTCRCFVAVPEKLPLYIKTHNELRAKEARAMEAGADVLVEQYQKQADQLSKIISSLEITS